MEVVLLISGPFNLRFSLNQPPETLCTYVRAAKPKSCSIAAPTACEILSLLFVWSKISSRRVEAAGHSETITVLRQMFTAFV